VTALIIIFQSRSKHHRHRVHTHYSTSRNVLHE